MSAEEVSKSARKRANKKANEAAAQEAPAPEPAPKAKAKAEAAPKAKAKAKAEAAPEPKAKAKAKAKAEAAPAPEPAAKAKAKAKGKAEAKAAAPEVTQAKPAAPKGEAKAKAKGKAKAKKEEEAPKKVVEEQQVFEMDDGTGGDWEVSAGVSKAQQKRKDKAEEKKKIEAEEQKAAEAEAKAAGKAAQNVSKKAAKANAQLTGNTPAAPTAAPKAVPVTTPAKVADASASAANAAKDKEPEKPKEVDPNVTATVKISQEKIGRIIGPKGANITMIKEKTGVKTVDTAGDMVTIVGLPAAVQLAETAIKELMEKGYMSMSFEDFKEDGVPVLPSSIPNLIHSEQIYPGEKGGIIKKIKSECQVEIDIPPVPKNLKLGTKVKVMVAGGAAGVEKAKEIITSIALYGHHEVTHPGYCHKELEVEEWRYRFLIGKGGCEMRHIQNNFQVRVNIPRDASQGDKVVVLGSERDVDRAVKYIEKILYEVNAEPTGRQEEKAVDTWGDEGPEEAWMSAYMYKRR